jgi:hypothetical protein
MAEFGKASVSYRVRCQVRVFAALFLALDGQEAEGMTFMAQGKRHTSAGNRTTIIR